ncbi:MAG: hypothetical protein ACOC1K_01575 [Nanoarchaeota archaeon]
MVRVYDYSSTDITMTGTLYDSMSSTSDPVIVSTNSEYNTVVTLTYSYKYETDNQKRLKKENRRVELESIKSGWFIKNDKKIKQYIRPDLKLRCVPLDGRGWA